MIIVVDNSLVQNTVDIEDELFSSHEMFKCFHCDLLAQFQYKAH